MDQLRNTCHGSEFWMPVLLQVQTEETIIHEKWLEDRHIDSPYNLALLRIKEAAPQKFPIVFHDHFKLETGQVFAITIAFDVSDFFGCFFARSRAIDQTCGDKAMCWITC